LIGEREHFFDGTFPMDIAQAIADASSDSDINVVMGKTVAGNEFFLEQMRLDGAIRLAEESWKIGWLNWIYEKGVRNIEMVGAMLAGFLNHWGFSRFAMICTVILNRMNGDQVTSTPAELHKFGENSGVVLFNYLDTIFA